MENIKVSEMPETTAANIDDLIMIIQGGGNKKITEKNLLGDSIVVSPTEPVGNNRRKVWFRKGKNLFNKNVPIITGYYLDDNGSLVSNEGSWYQNVFIEVNSKTQYTISSTVAVLRICFYDKDRKFISRVATENTSVTFSTPENCKYVRLSGNNADTQVQSLQLEQGSKATTYEAYIEPQIFIKNSNEVYEEFIKKNGEITLYENQDGNNGYEIELLDTVTKCAEVEIYGIGDNNIRIYQKILNPNQATFEMSSEVMYEGTEYINKALCAFINNKFYKYQDREYKIDVTSANVRNVTTSNWLKIVKIVGILN